MNSPDPDTSGDETYGKESNNHRPRLFGGRTITLNSFARTKADFLRIIKEKNPGEDLEQLKEKVLFDRVSELHISRLRSREDLQKFLAQ